MSELDKPSTTVEQYDQERGSHSGEAEDASAANTETKKAKVKRQCEWGLLIGLFVILVFVVVVQWRGGLFDSIATATAERNRPTRDLSTPLSRLLGHWANVNGSSDIYYGAIDAHSQAGTFTIHTRDGTFSRGFKVLFEERSGKKLTVKEYLQYADHSGTVVAEYYLSKDGRSMIKEYLLNEGPFLTYRYIDDKTAPQQ